MSTQLTSLFEEARKLPKLTPQVSQAIRQAAAYTRPDKDDAKAAIELGDKGCIEAILNSPRLAPDEKIDMASDMLAEFAKDPLAVPRQSEILTTLIKAGADVQKPDSNGKSPLDSIVERLERITSAEIQLNQEGRTRSASVARIKLEQLRDQLAQHIPVTRRSRVDVEQFYAGLNQSPNVAPVVAPRTP